MSEDKNTRIDECTTLSGVYNGYDKVEDVTEELGDSISEVVKRGSSFNAMENVTPDAIEAFMRGKVEHINAVHARSEEICRKRFDDKVAKYGTSSDRLLSERKSASNDAVKTEISGLKSEMEEIKALMKEILEKKK